MGVNMDIDVYVKNTICFSRVIDFLNKEGIFLEINKVEIIEDWKFNNYRELPAKIDNNTIIDELDKNNIVLIYATANKNIGCGVQIECNKYGFYEYGFYFDINSSGIEIYQINRHNLLLYNKITNIIKEVIDSNNLIICGIGEETSVTSYDDAYKIIQESSNLERWILPNAVKINNFIQSKYCELYVYDNKDLLASD